MKHCIVNFSNGYFKTGQERLRQSLIDVKYQGDILLFDNYSELGCKSHEEVPYQFKVYAIKEAQKRGYDVVLYCDASLYAIKDIMPCFNFIKSNGCILEYCGFSLGQFCTDTALNEFNITRDDAMNIPLHSAGFTGIDFTNSKSKEFFEEWFIHAQKEITFKGAWNNSNNTCSNDNRCLGHRHDQSVASYLAHKMDMNRTNPTFMQYSFQGVDVKPETIFLAKGVI